MKCLWYVLSIVSISFLTHVSWAQKSYDLRFRLATLDTIARTGCFDLELRNSGEEEWILSNYNIAIFYDTSAACFNDFSLLLDPGIYDPNITNIETSAIGTPLPYEASLGFIRAGLAANMAGVVMDTAGTWLPTIRICFDLKLQPITSPNTSFQVNFNSSSLQPSLGVPPNIVQEWNPGAFISDVMAGQVFDNLPAPTLSSSFVVEENTTSLCSDGIDNDEDGLIDCEDTDGCSAGNPSINVILPDCDGSSGRIRINASGPSLSYSIDGGISFVTDSIFDDLTPGNFDIVVRRFNIVDCQFTSPVMLPAPDCLEDTDDICSDGIDNDGDGLVDCDDPDCQPMIDAVEILPPENCPDLNDGSIIPQSLDLSSEISIDNGVSYIPFDSITGIGQGIYNLVIRNPKTGCRTSFTDNPIELIAVVSCIETGQACRDNIDNDGDGLVDCQDGDCAGEQNCMTPGTFYFPNAFVPEGQTNNRFGMYTPADEPITILRLTVFNRWGGQVYSVVNVLSSDPGHRWDGREQGTAVPTGVYVYQCVYRENGVEKTSYGSVTVIN